MVKSMTGYGSVLKSHPDFRVRIEIRSVNSKSFDCRINLPEEFSPGEITMRRITQEVLHRGKINAGISLEYDNPDLEKKPVNKALLKSYFNDFKSVADELGVDSGDVFGVVSRFREVLQESRFEPNETHWKLIQDDFREALHLCDEHRAAEGKELKAALNRYAAKLDALKNEIDGLKKERLQNIRARLVKNLKELGEEIDQHSENRLEQEMIFYAEKLDIEEELVRLASHLKYFLQHLEKDVCGKQLVFIVQELNREVNTIGSKANESRIQHLVVQMKEVLEHIREQALNVL